MTAKKILRIASFGTTPCISGTHYCLLTLQLDGGGKRSFSQLEIMRDIMHRLQCDEYPNDPDKVVLPCERFDLIGGSDIGGWVFIFPAFTVTDDLQAHRNHVCETEDVG